MFARSRHFGRLECLNKNCPPYCCPSNNTRNAAILGVASTQFVNHSNGSVYDSAFSVNVTWQSIYQLQRRHRTEYYLDHIGITTCATFALMLPLRHASELLDERSWQQYNDRQRALCHEFEDLHNLQNAASCVRHSDTMDVDATAPPSDVNLHQPVLHALLALKTSLESQHMMLENVTKTKPRHNTCDERYVYQLYHELDRRIRLSLLLLQKQVLRQMCTVFRLKCTCKAALRAATSNKWRHDALVRVPTLTVLWDATAGAQAPPTHASWNIPTTCTLIPQLGMVDTLDELHHSMKASHKHRQMHVTLFPINNTDTHVILDGYVIYIDVHALNRPAYHRQTW